MQIEMQAANATLGELGQYGTKGIFPIDTDKIVTSTNMKNGTYTIAAQPSAPCILSFSATAVGTADTMGTLALVGSLSGVAQSETITPIAGTIVYSTKEYDHVTSITGAGWVIDAGSGNDTILMGVGSVVPDDGYYFSAIQVITEAAVASQTVKTGSIAADLTKFTALPVGTYHTKLTKIALTSGTAIGYLSKL